MSAATHTEPLQDNGWQVEFKHDGIWYPTGSGIESFPIAWDAITLLAKSDGNRPVERRIVKFFD